MYFLDMRNISTLGERRATIKAHPTTPSTPLAPTGREIPPEMIESRQLLVICLKY